MLISKMTKIRCYVAPGMVVRADSAIFETFVVKSKEQYIEMGDDPQYDDCLFAVPATWAVGGGDSPWEELDDTITVMMDSEEYDWCSDTLYGILMTIRSTQYCTDRQIEVVENYRRKVEG